MKLKRFYLVLLSTSLLVLAFLSGCVDGSSPEPPSPPTLSQPSQTPTTLPIPAASLTASLTATRTAEPTATSQPTSPADTEPVSTDAEPTSAAPTVTLNPTAANTALPPAETASAADCENMAAFYADVTIPDNTPMNPNEKFTKTWRIRNEGSCTWEGYSLVFAGGSPLGSLYEVPISQTIVPDDLFDISIEMSAPPQSGSFTGFWQFQSASGEKFGVSANKKDLIWVIISVRQATPMPGNEANLPNNASANLKTDDDLTEPTEPTAPTTAGACQLQRSADYEATLLALINEARAQNGLDGLTLQAQLNGAALAHSNDMACNNFVDHIGSDGFSWTNRIKAQGYSYNTATENIYVGNPAFGGTVQGAFDWWMNSTVHRNNILDYRISEIGIAYVYYEDSTYGGYYTLVLAHP